MITSTNVVANAPVLGLRRLSVMPPFDSPSFLYRTGDYSYERDPYAEFLAPPAEILSGPLREFLRETGAFQEVCEPDSAIKPGILLECSVTGLYGDFRKQAAPTGVVSVRLTFLRPREGGAVEVVLQQEYEQRTGLKARTAASLVAGWTEGLRKIIGKAVQDYSRASSERHSVGTRSGPHSANRPVRNTG